MDELEVTFQQVYDLRHSMRTLDTKEKITLLNTFVTLEVVYPEIAKNLIENILLKNEDDTFVFETVGDVTKFIRQTSDYKVESLIYTMINSSFGEFLIKAIRKLYQQNIEFSKL